MNNPAYPKAIPVDKLKYRLKFNPFHDLQNLISWKDLLIPSTKNEPNDRNNTYD